MAEAEARARPRSASRAGSTRSFDGDYYLDVIRAVRAGSERIHIHALHRARGDRGRAALGGAADRVPGHAAGGRARRPCPARRPRSSTTRSGRCSAPTRSTPRSGSRPTAPPTRSACAPTSRSCSARSSSRARWARHMIVTRALQRETGGFTEFVPLPFVHMATPIYLQRRARRGPTFREALLMHAVGRIAYRGAIDNIQVSWVKMGLEGARQVLRPGPTTSAAPSWTRTSRGPPAPPTASAWRSRRWPSWSRPLGRPLVQRTTLYGRPPGAGQRVSAEGRVDGRAGRGLGGRPRPTPLATDPAGHRGRPSVPTTEAIETRSRRARRRPPAVAAARPTCCARCCRRSGR